MMNESGIGAAECLTALRLTNYNVQEAIKYVAPSSHHHLSFTMGQVWFAGPGRSRVVSHLFLLTFVFLPPSTCAASS